MYPVQARSWPGLPFVFLCSDLGDALFTSANTATGHFQGKKKYLYYLICISSLETTGTDMFSISWCALSWLQGFQGSPLIPGPKPGASGCCEHPWIVLGVGVLNSHLPAERCQEWTPLGWDDLQKGSHQHQRDLSLWKWWHWTHQTGIRAWQSWGMAGMESARERERSTWRYLRLSLASEEQGSNMKVHSQHPRASQGRIPCLIPVLTRAMADIWFLGSAGRGGVMCMSTLWGHPWQSSHQGWASWPASAFTLTLATGKESQRQEPFLTTTCRHPCLTLILLAQKGWGNKILGA